MRLESVLLAKGQYLYQLRRMLRQRFRAHFVGQDFSCPSVSPIDQVFVSTSRNGDDLCGHRRTETFFWSFGEPIPRLPKGCQMHQWPQRNPQSHTMAEARRHVQKRGADAAIIMVLYVKRKFVSRHPETRKSLEKLANR